MQAGDKDLPEVGRGFTRRKAPRGITAKVRAEILKTFYAFLIAPAEPHLAGKTKLILSPDEYLSFIPFEGLIDGSGKYLIEKYSVRYTPSMTVLRLVSERRYKGDRKPMLAFGGAKYEPYAASAQPAADEASFRQLQREVLERFGRKASQRASFAALGITGASWSYLPGTLDEVAAIKAMVPAADAFFAEDFTENRLKAMSKRGELARYKVLHLATHGLVVPTLPELSAVVTSLPMAEQGGEDGYLTAGEVKDLALAADFVALSACETGLGKIFAGEGIGGLMQAFLQAGANGMSVSLWAISDDATKAFMAGLYELVFKEKKSYAEAMTEMKRRFVAGKLGEEYRSPNYWAPFAYYGR
jgi:CHAT domain-containing protein